MTTGWQIAFSILWYVAVSCAAYYFGYRYNQWIEGDNGKQTATCYQVVIGVIATEFVRLARALPLMLFIIPMLCEMEWWVWLLVIIGGWPLDTLTGYGCTGWAMISGDLKRRASARADGVGEIVAEATGR